MKHRLLDGCLNPYKHHLWRLPSIPKEKQPPAYQDDSNDLLVIFPLFQTNEGDTSLEHHIVRAACWARRSWILFSDAVELNIKIAFYVGDTVINRVFPILEENGVNPDTHVFLLEEALFEGDPATHLGKKLSYFNDPQFRDYEWVLQMDSDMFLASPSRAKGAFFEFFEVLEKIPGAVNAHFVDCDTPPYQDNHLECAHWWHVLLHQVDDQTKMDEWLKRAAQFVDDDVLEAYRSYDKYYTSCHGGIYAFPTNYYQTERPSECEWIAEAGKSLQDDEAVFSLWHTSGKPLFSISRETGVPFCTEIMLLNEMSAKAEPLYLSHIGGLHEEWRWREDWDGL